MMTKRFSLRTLLTSIGVLCALLAFVVQERSRRRWETKYRYAVWHLENAQDYIDGRLDDNDKWRSRMIQKYGRTPASEETEAIAQAFIQQHDHLRLCLSDAWMFTGWDDNDEAQSENGPPR